MVTQPTQKTQPSECQTVTSPCLRPSIRAVSNTHSIRAVSSQLAKTHLNTLQCNNIDTKDEPKNFLKCHFIPTQYQDEPRVFFVFVFFLNVNLFLLSCWLFPALYGRQGSFGHLDSLS